jgi:spore germination protein YaaH
VRYRPLAIGLAVVLAACGSPVSPSPAAESTQAGVTEPSGVTEPTPTPVPTARPEPGHEVYGFVPYWEMGETIAAHVAKTRLTTLALFSVTNRRNGTLADNQNGYKRINGPIGRQMIREAHDRGVRVELVYTSFGYAKNARFFGGPVETQDVVIENLVKFADDLHFDGINVDVELLDAEFVPAYGDFVRRLREAVVAEQRADQVSVATTANVGGAAMAAAAATAGADRIFMMGYDYHWSGSDPGASSPMDRLDGDERDLVWSLDLYEAAGVPVDRTLLGLPLYGMAWPVDSDEPDAAKTGDGDAWIPRSHLDVLKDDAIKPELEPVEQVEIYRLPVERDGPDGWQVVYLDSPATLIPKMALADERGLAGVGFWAIGYERGLPGYTALIKRFNDGKLLTAE